jgi:hypothetical protein
MASRVAAAAAVLCLVLSVVGVGAQYTDNVTGFTSGAGLLTAAKCRQVRGLTTVRMFSARSLLVAQYVAGGQPTSDPGRSSGGVGGGGYRGGGRRR